MKLTPELTASLFNMLANLTISAVLSILKGINKDGATIDDAIAALEAAETKSIDQYKQEAIARLKAEGFTVTPPEGDAAVTVASPKGVSVTPVPDGSSVGIKITPP